MEAKATGRALPISTKKSVEICSFIRGKTTEKSKKLLEQVLAQKIAVPYKRFNDNVPHKPGKIAAGRYPLNAVTAILNVIKSAESNAESQGLSQPYTITEITASQGVRNWHPGRQRRRKTKSTHIKVTLKGTKQKEAPKKPTKKPELKKETKEKTEAKK